MAVVVGIALRGGEVTRQHGAGSLGPVRCESERGAVEGSRDHATAAGATAPRSRVDAKDPAVGRASWGLVEVRAVTNAAVADVALEVAHVAPSHVERT